MINLNFSGFDKNSVIIESKDFFIEPLKNQPMVTVESCLQLHDALLQQLLYLKIVIGVLILALILMLIVEFKRNKK